MQKVLKKITLVLAAALAVVCLGVFAIACTETAKDYSVTLVYADGSAVNGPTDGYNEYTEKTDAISVQICVVLKDGTTGTCFGLPVNVDAKGKATLAAPDYTLAEGEKFKIQVNNLPEGKTYEMPYVTEPCSITITIK